mmetsp:Transcript_20873/g.34940  ORF Transcript_20873/g.34940 Transcript_20873/m.34940 type:complete len:182 (-) Transcript_20873:463-1008(-)
MEAACMQIGRVPVLVRSPAIPAQRRGKGLSQLTSTPKEAARAQLVKSKAGRKVLLTVAHVGSVYQSPRAGEAGGGVLDKPAVAPKKDSDNEVSTTRKTKKPPQYRVLLHNDSFNKREYVVQVLLKIIPGMSVDIACNVMQEAHTHGKATVITAPQPDAEDYCEGMRANGLVASIEPASDKD